MQQGGLRRCSSVRRDCSGRKVPPSCAGWDPPEPPPQGSWGSARCPPCLGDPQGSAAGRAGQETWEGEPPPWELCSGVSVSGKGREWEEERKSPGACAPPGAGSSTRARGAEQRGAGAPAPRPGSGWHLASGSVGTGVWCHVCAQTSLEPTFHPAGLGLPPAQAPPGAPRWEQAAARLPWGVQGVGEPPGLGPLGRSRGLFSTRCLLAPACWWAPRLAPRVLEEGAELLPCFGCQSECWGAPTPLLRSPLWFGMC